jgi:hypothetical protein
LPMIQSIIVRGEPINGRTAFVPNDEGNFFYWGRRGPSVHRTWRDHILWPVALPRVISACR